MSNVNPKFVHTIMPCAFLQVNTADLCTDLYNISEVCENNRILHSFHIKRLAFQDLD